MVKKMEEILPYLCSCGGKLKKSFCNVEFFGIDFGVKECEVCSTCGSEFLDDQTLSNIEQQVKKRQIFGLEKQVSVAKSGNSLVFRIPPEIVKFANLKVKNIAKMFPVSKKRIEIELLN